MSDKSAIYKERVAMLNHVIEHKKTKRVPILSPMDNWALFYYGTTLREAKENAEIEYAAYEKAYTDFKFDAAVAPGITSPLKFTASLGGSIYANDMDTIQIETGKAEIMEADEYDQFIKDPKKFLINTILPRKAKIFQTKGVEEKFSGLANALQELSSFGMNKGSIAERFKKEHGLPILTAAAPFMPADIFLDSLRDFKGTMMDIRRQPDKFAEACMALLDLNISATYSTLPQPAEDKYITLFLHLPGYMKAKDFEKVYWPSFKKYIDTFAEKGYKFMIFFEKNWNHLHEFLQELPANCIMGIFEEDDLVKAKKVFGDRICIAGGPKVTDLQYKSRQECIDISKRFIDELAPDGGYIFTFNKIMLSGSDGKAENIKAVTDFVYEYGTYR